MPDLLPADHPDFRPIPPIDLHVANIESQVIDIACAWYITRVGRIPQGMHGFVFPYTEELEIKKNVHGLIQLIKDGKAKPMLCPQPAFKITHISECEELGYEEVPISPDTPYFFLFQTFNAAGKSELVGNFDPDTLKIDPVSTLPE